MLWVIVVHGMKSAVQTSLHKIAEIRAGVDGAIAPSLGSMSQEKYKILGGYDRRRFEAWS